MSDEESCPVEGKVIIFVDDQKESDAAFRLIENYVASKIMNRTTVNKPKKGHRI